MNACAASSGTSGPKRGYTLVEAMITSALAGLVVVMAFSIFRVAIRAHSRLCTQVEIQAEGRRAFEYVVRTLRGAFHSFEAVGAEIPDMGLENGVIFAVDTDHDGEPDGRRGWYVRPQAVGEDGGAQNELVEMSTPIYPSVYFSTNRVLCRHLVTPWNSRDGKHRYAPFELTGNDPHLDLGDDGVSGTGDTGEGDGLVSEAEIGNLVNGNRAIDHPAEVAKITTIAMGLKLKKSSLAYANRSETATTFEGKVSPRNWHPGTEDDEE